MRKRTFMGAALAVALTTIAVPNTVEAQVVEAREGESNPASVLFRSTLYGAGTGLVLSGAYALIDDDDVGERLRWGTAIGAGAGLVVGLVYIATRGDAEDEGQEARLPEPGGLLQLEDGAWSLSVPAISGRARDGRGPALRTLDVDVVAIKF